MLQFKESSEDSNFSLPYLGQSISSLPVRFSQGGKSLTFKSKAPRRAKTLHMSSRKEQQFAGCEKMEKNGSENSKGGQLCFLSIRNQLEMPNLNRAKIQSRKYNMTRKQKHVMCVGKTDVEALLRIRLQTMKCSLLSSVVRYLTSWRIEFYFLLCCNCIEVRIGNRYHRPLKVCFKISKEEKIF